MKRYIILGCARSGTTVTHQCLKGHPDVSALNDEVRIDYFFAKGLSSFTHGHNLLEENEKAHDTIFNAITSLCSDDRTTTLGMKTAISSLEDALILVKTIKSHLKDIYVIFTIRKDLVAQYGSLKLAVKSGKFHSWRERKKNIKGKIKLGKYRYIDYLFECLYIIEEIQKLKSTHRVLEFNYESDIQNGNWSKLFDFLGLEQQMKIDWLTSKKVAPNPQNYICNYNQLTMLTNNVMNQYYSGKSIKIYESNRKIIKKLRSIKNKTLQIYGILRN
jgi:hypothetical protein